MTEEQEPIAEIEQETAIEEVDSDLDNDDEGLDDELVDEPTEDNDEDADAEEEAEGDDQPEADLDTIEIDGETYEIPAKLKSGFMMQADYTRKTQETAERAKELESRAEQLDQQAEVTEEYLSSRAELHRIDSELERFKDWDWNAYQQARQTDPMGADEAWAYRQHLKDQKEAVNGQISEFDNQRTQKAQQDFAKRVEETSEFAKKNIKGWSPEVDQKLLQFAQEQEIPPTFLQKNMSPVLYKILHKAWIGEQSLSKQTAALKPAPKVKPKPAARIRAKTNPAATARVEEVNDMDEYARRRRKQMGMG